MVDFWIYDVSFLILFSVFVVWFLSSRKKDLSRDGIVFMYRTKFGIKAINYIGDKFKKTLYNLRYFIIGLGFVLMGLMLWMLGQTVSLYLMHPEITKLIKAPPIAPLIPYFPKLFGMQSYFPPFYFVYFILALAVVAIVHEFSHGIFMKLFKIKIKSTGLVFLGPILGAFVEQDDKSFEKKKKIERMTVLGAGVFANILFALIFYGLYVGLFFTSFAASGYAFNSYSAERLPISSVGKIGGNVGEMNVLLGGSSGIMNFTEVSINNKTYFATIETINSVHQGIDLENITTIFFEKTPAILAEMRGAIVQADDIKITGQDKLREFLESKNPGDIVKFITEEDAKIREYNIILGERPDNSSQAYLGVGHSSASKRGIIQNVLRMFMGFKDESIFYKPTWNDGIVYFIYNLLWWIMIINLLVALFNMMPLGALDGGHFFQLAMLGVFKSKKTAKKISKVVGYIILLSFVLMMILWFLKII